MSDCTCRKDIEAKLLERFKTNAPDATDHGVELAGYSFALMGNKMVSRPTMPIRASAMHPLKKGGAKLKKSEQSMFFNFCPFCGVKFEVPA